MLKNSYPVVWPQTYKLFFFPTFIMVLFTILPICTFKYIQYSMAIQNYFSRFGLLLLCSCVSLTLENRYTSIQNMYLLLLLTT